MTPQAGNGMVLVAFDVYACTVFPLAVVAEQLRAALPLPLVHRRGARRGDHWRWSGKDGPDLLVQANMPDEGGQLMEPAAPAGAALVYATDLPGEVRAALADIDGLTLLAAEVVEVPRWPGRRSEFPGRHDTAGRQRGPEGDRARDDAETLHVVR